MVNNESENDKTIVLLSTAIVLIRNKRGQECPLRFLIDSGSEKNFVTSRACRQLGLYIKPVYSTVTGFGGQSSKVQGRASFTIRSHADTTFSFAVDALVVEKILDRLPSREVDVSKLSYLKSLKLADDKFFIPGKLDGILGAEFFPDLINNYQSHQEVGSVKLVDSKLGFIVMGRAPVLNSSQNKQFNNCLLVSSPPLNDLVQRFWEVEDCPKSGNDLTPAELDCENNFRSSVRRLESGRFVVSLPFEKSADCLGDSYSMAKRRLTNLENRLARSEDIKIAYHEIMLDYLRQGHMTLIEDQENKQGYYIPHHAIVKARSTTTPVRIVYDASAKTTTGLSLNSILHAGQKLQTNIFVLLLNFRLFAIGVTGDLKQMYRQIFVSESCREFQRVLWRFSVDDPVETYEINCVVFGITSSPYLALRTIHELVEREGDNFPDAKARIPTDMFMDDLVTSVPSVSDAKKLCSQAKELFKAGGFELTKFASNSEELMTSLNDSERSLLSKEFNIENSLAILGLEWQPFSDSFRFFVSQGHSIATKRNILSAVARIYDPLGLVAPLTLFLKCLIKELWRIGSDWDEKPPDSIASQWEICQTEFQSLSNLSIPRHLGVFVGSKITLICFCDASQSGYGAVIYLKSQEKDGSSSTVTLLCGKSKVAPSKTLSIPRLELCAALLLVNLLEATLSVLELRCKIVRVVALSDSTVVLHWIRGSPSRWQTFVANRVSKIQNSRIDCWMHVSGEENPADCLSRGLKPMDLINHETWWTGPHWLTMEENHWPVKFEIEEIECPPEMKSSNVGTVVIVDQPNLPH
ncbi:uncharacterized protein LOC120355624 [Nilaparvata lugens]|uniref:uncharacterized protein LOC120355624 n=1 Tax=Nilaparvata lugens TaxID=108931 RepID=UPI00193E4C02|nr:uncharacterized protein LOC120355624 [Nilaparvata lugens]